MQVRVACRVASIVVVVVVVVVGLGVAGPGPVAVAGAAVGGIRLRHRPVSGGGECTSCGERRAIIEASSPDLELKAMRVEFIKQQILRKLRLKEPPAAVAPKSAMPKPLAVTNMILTGEMAKRHQRHRGEADDDAFFAKTDHVILFPYEGDKMRCPDLNESEGGDGRDQSPSPSSPPKECFPLMLPNEIQAEDLTSADLWLYRRTERPMDFGDLDTDPTDNSAEEPVQNMTLSVKELVNWDLDKSFQRLENLGSRQITYRGGWVKINLFNSVKSWLELGHNAHVMTMSCRGCDPSMPFLEVSGPFKPFLVIKTHASSRSRRPKRNVHCIPGMRECCRDELYISFKEIGWGDWIIQPAGYHANFCRGSCRTAESLPTVDSHYSSILRRAIMSAKNRTDLMQCCTPTQLSPLQLLYMVNNQTVTQTTLPKMVVDACGCM